MARHRELDELAGYARMLHTMAPNQYTPSVQRSNTDLTTILQRMMQQDSRELERFSLPYGPAINTDPHKNIVDPENLGNWPYKDDIELDREASQNEG
jgi:hypothetical protein